MRLSMCRRIRIKKHILWWLIAAAYSLALVVIWNFHSNHNETASADNNTSLRRVFQNELTEMNTKNDERSVHSLYNNNQTTAHQQKQHSSAATNLTNKKPKTTVDSSSLPTKTKKKSGIDCFCPNSCTASALRSSHNNKSYTCGNRIRFLMNRYALDEYDACVASSREEGAPCSIDCDPDRCGQCHVDKVAAVNNNNNNTTASFWRFDEAAPLVQQGVSHFVPSIPLKHRIPRDALEDLTSYFADNKQQRDYYLFEYNPSIVALPQHVMDRLIQEQKEQHDDDFYPTYLASFRVSTKTVCPFEDLLTTAANKNNGHKYYLALALLDEHLHIIDGYDFVVDLKPFIDDYRLFLLKDILYLSCNGPAGLPTHMAPIHISTTTTSDNTVVEQNKKKRRLQPLFGGNSKLQVTLLENLTPIVDGGPKGRNYQLFTTSQLQHQNNKEAALVEMWPILPRQVHQVELHPTRENKIRSKTKYILEDDTLLPDPSFRTMEQLWFPNKTVFHQQHHGTTCCIQINNPSFSTEEKTSDSPYLLVGVSHTKTIGLHHHTSIPCKSEIAGYQYVSSFYAFVPTPPYNIVARSGYFCMGFSEQQEEQDSWYAASTRLQGQFHFHLLEEQTFDCPMIHFISGMTVKANDDSKVILAYGINDCTSRMVQVDKAEIERLLFQGPTSKKKENRVFAVTRDEHQSAQVEHVDHTTTTTAKQRTPSVQVVVPGHGDLNSTSALASRLDHLVSTFDKANIPTSCAILVYKQELMPTIIDIFATLCKPCDVLFSQGLWTNHMLRAPASSSSHVLLVLDDMDISSLDGPAFLNDMSLSGFDAASVAVPQWHYRSHRPRRNCISHETGHVDILVTAFTRAAWNCWSHNINLVLNPLGWGYDLTFADLCHVRLGVLDSFSVKHIRGSADGKSGSMYSQEAAFAQMWAWIKNVTGKQTEEEQIRYHDYVALERHKTFPQCLLKK